MTLKDKTFEVLTDGNWHCFRELLAAYYKYTQRIKDFRDDGFIILTKKCEHGNKHALDYRLAAKNPVVSPTVATPKASTATPHLPEKQLDFICAKQDQHGNQTIVCRVM